VLHITDSIKQIDVTLPGSQSSPWFQIIHYTTLLPALAPIFYLISL